MAQGPEIGGELAGKCPDNGLFAGFLLFLACDLLFQHFAIFLDTFLRSVFETAFRELQVPILEGFW